jgi:hypothetical protein
MASRLFEVTIIGRRLWIEVDGSLRCVGFRVSRVIDAIDADDAANQALVQVRAEPKARGIAGRPPPELSVERVAAAASKPAVQPGFLFFPD